MGHVQSSPAVKLNIGGRQVICVGCSGWSSICIVQSCTVLVGGPFLGKCNTYRSSLLRWLWVLLEKTTSGSVFLQRRKLGGSRYHPNLRITVSRGWLCRWSSCSGTRPNLMPSTPPYRT